MNPDKALIEAIAKFYYDPEGFVRFAFDWGGQKLENADIEGWQKEILNGLKGRKGGSTKIAVASGHGIGKSTLVAWVIIWFMSTRPNPQIVVTANTKTQLETKTWRELAKWHRMSINAGWFEWTKDRFYLKACPETWFAAAVPWSRERSEAFAGTHEENVLIIFDEASLIDDEIWEVAEGAMTEAGAYWLAFGNPTRNTGRFRECFGRFRHRWQTMQIDSRTVGRTNKEEIKSWADDYGEDSDFFRVRVKGEFPRAGSLQLIDEETVSNAEKRESPASAVQYAPVIIGVDVARYGDDKSAVAVRRGVSLISLETFSGENTMRLAAVTAARIEKFGADAVFIDAGAMGAGVIDRLRQLGYRVQEVHFGSSSAEPQRYRNKRAEMWMNMADWLKSASIPYVRELSADLTAPEYMYDSAGRIQIEKKEDMKKRGLASPDTADALALTFAHPVRKTGQIKPRTAEADYEIFA